MSPSLPAPSKGALRALRHIALGTSCTVAFGTGLITEDRRRRINTAREVSENARRLKASRKYHSAGLLVTATFEEQVENYCKHGPWKEGNKQGILGPDWSDGPPNVALSTESSHIEPIASLDLSGSDRTETQRLGKFGTIEMTNWIPWRPFNSPKVKRLPPANSTAETCRIKRVYTEKQLAMEMYTILKSRSDAEGVDNAAATFHEAFRGGLKINAVDKPLLDACILLAQACDRHEKLDTFVPVLRKILSFGHPINEESFYKLHAGKVIARLLEESGYRHADHQVVTNISMLKLAVAIFTTQTGEKPKPLPMEMQSLGLQLCTATFRAKLYELTEALYWRLLTARTDPTTLEVEYLILAEYERASYDRVLEHFLQYFPKTLPNQSQLYNVVGAAINSALELKRLDKAEEVLSTASQMAKNENLRTSTTWHLRVLGEHWRTARDIKSTEALFDRLEATIEFTGHPQAIYSAIIQFCVESGSESEALRHLEQLKQICGGDNIGLRTYGHLALAKAMRGDWNGVEADFHFMKGFANESTPEYSDVFVPILKLFVASHDVTQVEDFVHLYFDKLDVVPNQYIFNIIVDTYCKAGEMSSIPSWIEYVRPLGLHIDAVTLNTILSHCHKKWAMHFDDLFRLYKGTQGTIGPMVDSTTIEILRNAAIASSNPRRAVRIMQKQKVKSSIKLSKSNKIEGDMREALARGEPKKALKSYRFALRTEIPISPQVFAIAVRASIQSAAGGNLSSTIKLLAEGRSRGIDIFPSMTQLLLYQVDTSNCDSEDLVSFVKHALIELEDQGLEVTLPVASKTAGILIDRGSPRQAIMLWNALTSHDRIARQQIDLVLLTVLLRAYVILSDLVGIKWVMAVLVENNIVPDAHFKHVLKRARRDARRFMEMQPDSSDAKHRYDVLDESVRRVVAQRLHCETKRKEAEQVTFQILENALAMKSNTTKSESRQNLSEIWGIKRAQRLGMMGTGKADMTMKDIIRKEPV